MLISVPTNIPGRWQLWVLTLSWWTGLTKVTLHSGRIARSLSSGGYCVDYTWILLPSGWVFLSYSSQFHHHPLTSKIATRLCRISIVSLPPPTSSSSVPCLIQALFKTVPHTIQSSYSRVSYNVVKSVDCLSSYDFSVPSALFYLSLSLPLPSFSFLLSIFLSYPSFFCFHSVRALTGGKPQITIMTDCLTEAAVSTGMFAFILFALSLSHQFPH